MYAIIIFNRKTGVCSYSSFALHYEMMNVCTCGKRKGVVHTFIVGRTEVIFMPDWEFQNVRLTSAKMRVPSVH